jgi:hypothetical protein
MPREPADFRDNIEILNTMFPGLAMLNYEQVMTATGWKCIKTIKKRLPVVNEQVSKVALAKYMCGGGVK